MSKCHVFLVDDAVEHGIEKAVILYNLRFWLDKVKANNKERSKHEGYYWTFNSVTAFKELFPYLSEGQLQRHLKGLEKDGVILAGVFNKKGYDRTKWYSMPEFKIDDTVHQNQQDHSLDLTNDFIGIDEPIPYVIADVIADVISNTISDEKPKAAKKKKHDIPDDFTATDKQIEKCKEYGINVQELISGFDDFHSSKGNQYVDWSKAFNTWINNHIKFEKLKPINQGNNNAKHQSANSQPSHFDKLRAEIAAKYGTSEQPRDIRTVNPATRDDDEYV